MFTADQLANQNYDNITSQLTVFVQLNNTQTILRTKQ